MDVVLKMLRDKEKKDTMPRNVVRIYLFLVSVIIGVDQLTKVLSSHYLKSSSFVSILPGFGLTLRHNKGAAFSFLAEASGWQRWFFVGITILVSIVIYQWLKKLSAKERKEGIALTLILGGAWGNLIDRIFHGHVIDFILLYYKSWQWPAFNIADSAICLGVVMLIPSIFKREF